MKTMNKAKYRGDKLNQLRTMKLFAVLVAVFLLIFGFLIGISFVNGNSMYPTAKSGHIVIYFKAQKNFSRGDIVAVKMASGERLLKRVIAVEGDTVDIRDGIVYVNGTAEDGSYVNGETTLPADAGPAEYPITIGVGQVYLLGDNRELSVDSRSIGPVAESQIQGKVIWLP